MSERSETFTGNARGDLMIDVSVYAPPTCPPPRWFSRLGLTQATYNAKCAWLLPRLDLIANHLGFLAVEPPDHPTDDYQNAVCSYRQIVTDELAAWITCCWAASATTTNLGLLPNGRHWAVTTDHIPSRVANVIPRVIRESMRTEANHFLTEAARGVVSPPLKDWGYQPIYLLIGILLDALAHSHNPDLPQPVTAEPGEWPPR